MPILAKTREFIHASLSWATWSSYSSAMNSFRKFEKGTRSSYSWSLELWIIGACIHHIFFELWSAVSFHSIFVPSRSQISAHYQRLICSFLPSGRAYKTNHKRSKEHKLSLILGKPSLTCLHTYPTNTSRRNPQNSMVRLPENIYLGSFLPGIHYLSTDGGTGI